MKQLRTIVLQLQGFLIIRERLQKKEALKKGDQMTSDERNQRQLETGS
jgi:hypothetical protein